MEKLAAAFRACSAASAGNWETWVSVAMAAEPATAAEPNVNSNARSRPSGLSQEHFGEEGEEAWRTSQPLLPSDWGETKQQVATIAPDREEVTMAKTEGLGAKH
jgi:hypothetical protein